MKINQIIGYQVICLAKDILNFGLLGPRETAVYAALLDDAALDDLAKKFNITRNRVRQIAIRAAIRLRSRTCKMREDTQAFQHDNKILKTKILLLEKEIDALREELKKEERVKDLNCNKAVLEELSTEIYDLPFTSRVINAMRSGNIKTLYQMISMKPKDFLRYRNVGVKSLREINEVLGRLGYRMGMSKDEIDMLLHNGKNEEDR